MPPTGSRRPGRRPRCRATSSRLRVPAPLPPWFPVALNAEAVREGSRAILPVRRCPIGAATGGFSTQEWKAPSYRTSLPSPAPVEGARHSAGVETRARGGGGSRAAARPGLRDPACATRPARPGLRDPRLVHEAIPSRRLDKDSFRRTVRDRRLVMPTGERTTGVGHRPPELHRFADSVLPVLLHRARRLRLVGVAGRRTPRRRAASDRDVRPPVGGEDQGRHRAPGRGPAAHLRAGHPWVAPHPGVGSPPPSARPGRPARRRR